MCSNSFRKITITYKAWAIKLASSEAHCVPRCLICTSAPSSTVGFVDSPRPSPRARMTPVALHTAILLVGGGRSSYEEWGGAWAAVSYRLICRIHQRLQEFILTLSLRLHEPWEGVSRPNGRYRAIGTPWKRSPVRMDSSVQSLLQKWRAVALWQHRSFIVLFQIFLGLFVLVQTKHAEVRSSLVLLWRFGSFLLLSFPLSTN